MSENTSIKVGSRWRRMQDNKIVEIVYVDELNMEAWWREITDVGCGMAIEKCGEARASDLFDFVVWKNYERVF